MEAAKWTKDIGDFKDYYRFVKNTIDCNNKMTEKALKNDELAQASFYFFNIALWSRELHDNKSAERYLEQGYLIINRIKSEFKYFTQLLLVTGLDDFNQHDFNQRIISWCESKNPEQARDLKEIMVIIKNARQSIMYTSNRDFYPF